MEWGFEVVENKFLEVTVTGQFSVKEMRSMFDDIEWLPFWNNQMPILFDNSELSLEGVDTKTIIDAVSVLTRFCLQHPLVKVAGLVKGNLNFGLGRQFENISMVEGNNSFRLFKDRTEATGWVFTD